ncbi:MAG: hypothetical protein EHM61_23095 [Acidobacteria bacterium]|nr:MAG: hypothetical protein EHM61_23095 [Acidobacteriota bacterium]
MLPAPGTLGGSLDDSVRDGIVERAAFHASLPDLETGGEGQPASVVVRVMVAGYFLGGLTRQASEATANPGERQGILAEAIRDSHQVEENTENNATPFPHGRAV